MAKKFSAKDKEKAVRLVLEGNLPQQQIADKIGCSVAALQLWKRSFQNNQYITEEEEWEDAEGEKEAAFEPVKAPVSGNHGTWTKQKNQDAVQNLKKQYWGENSRAVDMLLDPKNADPDEVVKRINEALEYAYTYCKK